MAARHARAQARGGPDYFGEEHLLSQLQLFLDKLGIEESEVKAQLDRLTLANNLLDPVALVTVSEVGSLTVVQPEGEASAGSEEAVMVPEVPVITAEIDEDFALDDGGDDSIEGPLNEDVLKAELAQAAVEEKVELPTAYLCSVSQRGRFRRLHYAGACWRKPGVHFLEWEDLGLDPDLSKVDARCSDCFPAARPELRREEAEAASDEDASSSSSSSSSSPAEEA